MRSSSDFIITKHEVQDEVLSWLETSLKLEHRGTKCTDSLIWKILLLAAARLTSIFAVCTDLENAPSDQAIRDALVL